MDSDADRLRERAAEVSEAFNASVDPAERVELYRELERLRAAVRDAENGEAS